MTVSPEQLPKPGQFNSFQDIVDAAPLGHIDLSYHNFPGHILETINAVPVFCDWAESNGITDVPQDPLVVTMANHDYGIHLPLSVKQTVTDEVYSALNIGGKLIRFPKGREVLSLCVRGVMASTPNLAPQSNFELAVRWIDTGNVCSEDFTSVLGNTLKVITEEELELKTRKTDSFIEKRDKIANFLRAFYFPGTAEFVSEDGQIVPYEPALIGAENVQRLGSISRKEFIDLVPEAEEIFAILWPEQKIF